MSSFLKNTLKLVSGSVIAQTVGILLIPIVTRLYSPDDFGILQLFISITGILAAVSCFAYQLSIMLPKKDEDAANIVGLCIGLISVTSVISGFILIIFAEQVASLLNAPEIANYMVLIPVVVFLNGVFLVFNYWLSRHVRFGSVATARVANSLTGKVVQIGAGMGTPSALGLIGGTIAGYSFGNLIMLKEIWKHSELFKQISWKAIRINAIRYKKFPIYTTWSTVANTMSLQIAPFMLSAFFTVAVVGQYSIANQAVHLPMGLIGGAVGQVFFQKASEQMNKTGNINGLVRDVYTRLISIGIFPILILIIIGEELFGFVFGANWITAGLYAKILAPWLLLVFIASPLSTLFSVLEKQGVGLSFNIAMLLSRVIVLYAGGMFGDPLIALVLYSITGVFFWGGMNIYILEMSGVKKADAIKKFIGYILLASFVSLPLVIAKYLNLDLYLLFAIALMVTVVYYFIVIINDNVLKYEFTKILKRD
ncbi:lipopolysaccharide biosynthesis protein [Methanogenium organophilum]|uniref:Oligosaccharide flippase family protein n=1 Tax=Methanogenium organophilum TaxID=2199 RepID=A0A9X9S3M7_METOG|nr:oligosaccharide flippase family protein [Methanogenium organophilum]WAI01188.1 oligosaccharide flippase family protein [Methanogenium organophilum]